MGFNPLGSILNRLFRNELNRMLEELFNDLSSTSGTATESEKLIKDFLNGNRVVKSNMLDFYAVSTDNLAEGAVKKSRLATPAVDGENIYTGAITPSKIADNAIAERHILNRQVTRSKLSHNFLFNRLVASNEPIESVLTDGTYQIAPNNTGNIPEELIANDHFCMSVEVVGNFAYQTLFRLTDPSKRFVRVINTLDNVIRPWHKFNFGNSTNGGHMPRKIFMIGNSFSLNSTEYLHHLCAEAGIDVTIGVMYRAGESLESHYTNLQNESANYTYYERISENGVARSTTTPNQSLRDGARKHDWDTVMFLQRPEMSGDSSTFFPYINDLISMVKTEVSDDIKVGLMQTWSFSKVKDPNADVMYSNIVSAFDEVMYESNIEYIIPIGTAIQNARSNEKMNEVDEELTSDGIHLGNLGKYIAALTGFESLFPNSSCKALEYTPQGVTNYQKYIAKLAANNANINPKIVIEL